jgi:hypothetical protein
MNPDNNIHFRALNVYVVNLNVQRCDLLELPQRIKTREALFNERIIVNIALVNQKPASKRSIASCSVAFKLNQVHSEYIALFNFLR